MNLFKRIIWFTYRSDFPCIKGEILSDTGWGCMIRAGQMLMAQALRKHRGADTQE
jgi:cysteine protease ATG4